MTSAAELFYNWRSRLGARNPKSDLGLDPTLPSDRDHPDLFRHPRRRHAHRRPLHRHRAFQSEHESVRSDYSVPHDSETGNSSNGGTASSRVSRLSLIRNDIGNDRLPGAVLQARARLLERLRGISLTGNRQNSTASSISWEELAVGDDFVVIDSGDWETEAPREWLEPGIQFTDLAPEANQAGFLQNVSKKKPPGLSWEAVCSLPQEFFKDGEESGVLRASLECCICLERFGEGDRLFRLPCDHRFHPSCLEPWLLTCGDCPYCRASI